MTELGREVETLSVAVIAIVAPSIVATTDRAGVAVTWTGDPSSIELSTSPGAAEVGRVAGGVASNVAKLVCPVGDVDDEGEVVVARTTGGSTVVMANRKTGTHWAKRGAIVVCS